MPDSIPKSPLSVTVVGGSTGGGSGAGGTVDQGASGTLPWKVADAAVKGVLDAINGKTPPLGQTTQAGSSPVVLPSDQVVQTAVLSLPGDPAQEHLTAGAPSSVRLSDGASFYRATTPADTQPISGSVDVTDRSGRVLGKVTANVGTTGGLALNSTLTSGAQGTRIVFGAFVAEVLSSGALKVDGSATTQPVSAASLPLPAGAATSANQTTVITYLSSLDAKSPALVSGRVPVDGSGVTQPVSGTVAVSSLPGSPTQEHITAGSYHSVRLTDGTSFFDPRQIRALTSSDVVTANVGATGGLPLMPP